MTMKIGREFMLRTRYAELPPSGQAQGHPEPPPEWRPPTSGPIRSLPALSKVPVPDMTLNMAIEQRRSTRKYDEDPLSQEELAYLLWTTQGVQRLFQGRVTMRTVPSAGARHAFETILLINRVDGFSPGLYWYSALQHGLSALPAEKDIAARLTQACLNQTMIHTAAVTFFWVAITERMTWRYSERGYRYLLLDAGHVGQNLYLAAESLNCGACAIAAYLDDEVDSLLGLNGEDQFVIYLATLGRAKGSDR